MGWLRGRIDRFVDETIESETDTVDGACGGHREGDTLVLSDALGSSRHRLVAMDEEVLAGVGKGEFHLLFQPFGMKVEAKGQPLMTSEPVGRDLASAVCAHGENMGFLSVYTPDGSDARDLMSSSTGRLTRLYDRVPSETLTLCMSGYRRMLYPDEGCLGAVAFFGTILPGSDRDDGRSMEAALGIVPVEGDTVRLASDLGGWVAEFSELDGTSLDSCRAGDLHIVFEMVRTTRKRLEPMGKTYISRDPVDRETAILICADMGRFGCLNVYTRNREDALGIMTDACGGQTPREELSSRGEMTVDLPCFRRSDYVEGEMRNRPRALFGQRTLE